MSGDYNGKPMVPIDYEKDCARFWGKVDRRKPDECWLWTGGKVTSGYGCFGLGGTVHRAHRVAWFFTFGPIPHNENFKRLCVCHACDTPACVNPAHLFLGSDRTNNLDCANKGRKDTKSGVLALLANAKVRGSQPNCKRGHPLSGDNLYIPASGSRVCKECTRMAKRRYRARLAEALQVMPGTDPDELINEVKNEAR